MNKIQFEIKPMQKGRHAFVFFGEIPEHAFQDELCMEYGVCREKEWAMNLEIGGVLQINGVIYFKVLSKHFMPFSPLPVYILQCVTNFPEVLEQKKTGDEINIFQTYAFEYSKKSYNLAVITLSDKGFVGKRVDESAPAISKLVNEKIVFEEERYFILPDDAIALKGLVSSLAYTQGFDCIITTGGTGLSERDVTPNALLPMLDQRLYGFEHAMMQASLEKTPTAMLSRAFCGIIYKTIIISVPGSVKASTENIEAILPALPHALAKLQGDMTDCGRV